MQSVVELFLELVKIDSPTGDEKHFRTHLAKLFSREGGRAETDEAGNLLIRFAGNDNGNPPLLFSAHMDTVEPGHSIQPHVNTDGFIVSDGSTILGADDKDGIAAFLWAVRKIREKQSRHPPLEFLFTVGEENNLTGAAHLRPDWISAGRGWIFDGPGAIGTIYRNGVGKTGFRIKIKGRPAHAALNPEEGINVFPALAACVLKSLPGHYGSSTLNYGTLSGGSADNVVPAGIEITGEIRSREEKELDNITLTVKTAWEKNCAQYGCLMQWIPASGYPSFALPPDSEHYRNTCETMRLMGLRPELEIFRAACDANYLSCFGIDLCIIGTGRKFNHSTREITSCSNLETLANLAFALMTRE